MTTIHRTAALFAVLALAGCEMPLSDSATSLEDASSFDAAGASDDGLAQASPEVRGRLHGVGAIELVDASVCLADAGHCVTADALGRFSIQGIEAGVSEVVVIRADGYVPLVVPFELAATDRQWLDLELEPVGGRSGAGGVRFVTYRLDGYWERNDGQVQWTVQVGDADEPRSASGLDPRIEGMSPGTHQARFLSKEPLICGRTSGWSGADANEVSFPVLPGAITHVEQYCLSMQ